MRSFEQIIMQNRIIEEKNDFQLTIERICMMEEIMDEVLKITNENPEQIACDTEIQEKIRILENYIDSGMWLQDYECDERGELPVDLKRGILSEDTLYDLLCEIKWNCGKDN